MHVILLGVCEFVKIVKGRAALPLWAIMKLR